MGAPIIRGRYKTELCVNFPSCSYGKKCLFAHGKEDLRKKKGTQPIEKTTAVCRFYLRGVCTKDPCPFIHSKTRNVRKMEPQGLPPQEESVQVVAAAVHQTSLPPVPPEAETKKYASNFDESFILQPDAQVLLNRMAAEHLQNTLALLELNSQLAILRQMAAIQESAQENVPPQRGQASSGRNIMPLDRSEFGYKLSPYIVTPNQPKEFPGEPTQTYSLDATENASDGRSLFHHKFLK